MVRFDWHIKERINFKLKTRKRNLVRFGAEQVLLCDYSKISNVPISFQGKESFLWPAQWFQGRWLRTNAGGVEQHCFSR